MGSSSAIAAALQQQSTANSGTGSTNNALSLASNFNTFLNLLTTQLQNQDPTNPVDSNQFTQQLVEFAGVQQQVQSNTYLQQLVSATQANQVSSASSFIGTTIQATGDQGALSSSTPAEFGYTLASTATSAQVTIKDSSGNTVFVGSGPVTAGSNVVQWNGTNSLNGSTEPAGTYTISVSAKDASGNAITATPYITGVVNSASISNGSVVLNVNGLSVPVGNVTSVTNLPGTTTSTSSTGTSNTNTSS